MLLSNFKAHGPISIPSPPTVTLIEFFHADTVASVYPLQVSWYSISSRWVYLCSCMHIMSTLCSPADAVSSGSWPILFKVLTLNVVICIVCLHFRSFCCLSSIADFSNTEVRAPTTAESAPFFTRAKSDMVYTCGLNVGHGYLSTAVFIPIHRNHPYRWAAVVPRSNWRSWPLSPEIHTRRNRLGIVLGRQRVYSHSLSTMLLPMAFVKKKNKLIKNPFFFSVKF